MSAINRDTRLALKCAMAIHRGKVDTCRLFGGFPSERVEPGTYDRVGGRWVLREDGGSVALQHRAKSSGALAHPSNLRGASPAVRPRRSDASVRAELSAKRAAGRIGQRGEVEFWMVLALAAFALFVLAYVVNESADRERCEARGGYWYHAYQSAGVCLAKGMVLP